MRAAAALAWTVLAACGSGAPDLGTPWFDRPVEKVTGTVNGIAYSIELPAGMSSIAGEAGSTMYSVSHPDGKNKLYPFVSVGTAPMPPTLDESAQAASRKFVRKEMVGPVALQSEDTSGPRGESFMIRAEIPATPTTMLVCTAALRPWPKQPSVRGKLEQLEKVCLSLKPAS